MSKAMYINVVNEEESRIAIVSDGLLEELSIETSSDELIEGNIYKARVEKVLPSLDAAFLDYGREKNGFITMSEVRAEYFTDGVRKAENLKRGQELVVQVKKGEIGDKGAALTSFISIPGRYMVLMPHVDKHGVSRQIQDEAKRKLLKAALADSAIPEGMGYIVRTAAKDQKKPDIQRDATYLMKLYERIMAQEKTIKAPARLYRESDIVIRTIRDYFNTDITEVLVDDEKIFERVKGFFRAVIPWHARKVKHYDGRAPLFSKHNLEAQINTINDEKVKLPSGGSIVIQQTEALVSVDVNSGGGAKSKDIEETALNTNMEAASEVARQLRLRDMGGLIVIDFIDMRSSASRTKIKKELQKSLKDDKARTDIGTISKFGLLELSRQRIRRAASLTLTTTCPVCNGTGTLRSTEGFALSVLRLIQSVLARSKQVKGVSVSVPVETATFLLNRKRQKLALLESRFKTLVDIYAEPLLPLNTYHMEFMLPDRKRVETNLSSDYATGHLNSKTSLPQPESQELEDEIGYADMNGADTTATAPSPDSAPATSADGTAEQAPEGQQQGEEEQSSDTSSSKRRRRRRRRRRRGGEQNNRQGEGEAQNGEGATASQVAGSPPSPEAGAAQSAPIAEAQPQATAPQEIVLQKPANAEEAGIAKQQSAPEATSESSVETTGATAGEAAEPTAKRPSRRRPRRRSPKPRGETTSQEQTTEATHGQTDATLETSAPTDNLSQAEPLSQPEKSAPPAHEDVKPKPPRKRTSRRRTPAKPAQADTPAVPTIERTDDTANERVKEVQKTADEAAEKSTATAAEKAEQPSAEKATEKKAPAKKRAPRRRAPAKKAAADTAAKEESAATSEAEVTSGDEKAKAEKKPAPKKRAPARKKAAPKKAAEEVVDGEAKEPPKRAAKKAPAKRKPAKKAATKKVAEKKDAE